jgi:atypical protein kinase C zeta type
MRTLKGLRRGATGIIYRVNSLIVVKCPTVEGHKDFIKENQIFDILTQHPPCPELVVSFLRLEKGNFLEYMPGFSLSERLQRRQIRDPNLHGSCQYRASSHFRCARHG